MQKPPKDYVGITGNGITKTFNLPSASLFLRPGRCVCKCLVGVLYRCREPLFWSLVSFIPFFFLLHLVLIPSSCMDVWDPYFGVSSPSNHFSFSFIFSSSSFVLYVCLGFLSWSLSLSFRSFLFLLLHLLLILRLVWV